MNCRSNYTDFTQLTDTRGVMKKKRTAKKIKADKTKGETIFT